MLFSFIEFAFIWESLVLDLPILFHQQRICLDSEYIP